MQHLWILQFVLTILQAHLKPIAVISLVLMAPVCSCREIRPTAGLGDAIITAVPF